MFFNFQGKEICHLTVCLALFMAAKGLTLLQNEFDGLNHDHDIIIRNTIRFRWESGLWILFAGPNALLNLENAKHV